MYTTSRLTLFLRSLFVHFSFSLLTLSFRVYYHWISVSYSHSNDGQLLWDSSEYQHCINSKPHYIDVAYTLYISTIYYTVHCTSHQDLPRDETSRQKMHCPKMRHLSSTLHISTAWYIHTSIKICQEMSHLDRKCTAQRCGILAAHYTYAQHMVKLHTLHTHTKNLPTYALTFNLFGGKLGWKLVIQMAEQVCLHLLIMVTVVASVLSIHK